LQISLDKNEFLRYNACIFNQTTVSNGVHSFCTYGADGMGALSFFLENLFCRKYRVMMTAYLRWTKRSVQYADKNGSLRYNACMFNQTAMSNGVHSFCTYGADGMGALSFFRSDMNET